MSIKFVDFSDAQYYISFENVQVGVDNITLVSRVSMSARVLLLTELVKAPCIGSSYSDIISISFVKKD